MATVKDVLDKQLSIESMVNTRLDDFEKRMKALSSSDKKSHLENLAGDFTAFKEMVVGVLRLLQEQLASLAGQVEEMDCHSRRNALLFSGVEEHDGEDPVALITSIITGKMGLTDFGVSMIQHCVRIGAKNPKRKRPRPILVRLSSISVKASIWDRKKQLKSSGTVVGEFLTKSRQDIYARARRHFGMNACWTMNGAVFLKLPDNSMAKITSAAQLDELCGKHPAVAPTTTAAAKTLNDKPASRPKLTPAAAAPVTRSKTGTTSKDKPK